MSPSGVDTPFGPGASNSRPSISDRHSLIASIAEHAARAVAVSADEDDWTQAGVVERRDHSLEQLAREWDTVGLPTRSRLIAIVRLDLTVHLSDILETFGDRRGPDTELVESTLRQYYDNVAVLRCGEVGPVPVLRCSDTGTRVGAGLSVPEIAGTAYELLSAICGRRTRVEADEHLDWGTTPASTREAFAVDGWPTR